MRYKSARQIWRESLTADTGSNWSDTNGSSDNDRKVFSCVQKGKAQCIIQRLPVIERSWGNYAYADFTETERSTVQDHLLSIWVEYKKRGYYKRMARYLLLIEHAMKDMRHRLATKQPLFKTSDYCKALDITDSNWKPWGKRLYEITRELDNLDKRALEPLGVLIDD